MPAITVDGGSDSNSVELQIVAGPGTPPPSYSEACQLGTTELLDRAHCSGIASGSYVVTRAVDFQPLNVTGKYRRAPPCRASEDRTHFVSGA